MTPDIALDVDSTPTTADSTSTPSAPPRLPHTKRRRRSRRRYARYVVKELSPCVWGIPLNVDVDDLDLALKVYADRLLLHVQRFGQPRPLLLFDRATDAVIRSSLVRVSTDPPILIA